MKLITGATIKNAIRDISPSIVAVAYVGIDWASYVETTTLQEIILSPTIGSNPLAITQLAEKLDWDNVYFLDNLHSKIYLGATHAAVGSFNLTANGLSAMGLEEAGYVVTGQEALEVLRTLVEQYKSYARAAYPTTDTKLARLAELRAIWDRAIKTGAIRNDSLSRDLAEYLTPGPHESYVCWSWGGMNYSDQVVSPSTINMSLSFLESDEIKPDRWILCWTPRNDGSPDDRHKPYWLHIDEIVSNGAIDTQYTKIAIERNDRHMLHPPFDLTDAAVRALRAVLRSGQFPEFLDSGAPWSVNDTLPRLSEFFEAVRHEQLQGHKDDEGTEKASEAEMQTKLRQLFKTRIEVATNLAVDKKFIKPTIQGMLQKMHAVELAKKLVRDPKVKSGLKNLAKADALDLSFERIMLEPQFLPLFSPSDLDCAQWNLSQA